MKLAIFSDVHANLEALEACLDDAARQGATRLAFLGDLVGYGADPAAVVRRVAGLVDAGAVAVRGNHDEAVFGNAGYLNELATTAIDYTRGVLAAGDARFLRDLPLIVREGDLCFVHGSAAAPERYPYVDSPSEAARCAAAAERAYTFCGHMHDQRLFFAATPGRMQAFRPTPGIAVPVPAHRRWVAMVGSCGQPRDRNPQAAYAMFDAARAAVTFLRVPYDHLAAARKIRAAGLPEALAKRVEHGV